MFEAVGESIMHKFPSVKRAPMLIILCVVCFGIGVNMEAITSWGPWMDFVSIYIIPIGAVIGAVSWFWVIKKDEIIDEINTGAAKIQGDLWYNIGRYVYVPMALTLCIITLVCKFRFKIRAIRGVNRPYRS